MKTVDTIVVEINKLNIGENDFLVLKFPDGTDYKNLTYISDTLNDRLPKLSDKLLLIAGDIEIFVAHKGEI